MLVSKHFTDEPEAPYSLAASDITPTTATLSWLPPDSDGGSPILGYTLEIKDKFSSRWTKVNKGLLQETSFKVTNLEENNEYTYRVIAENKAGPSKPSNECKFIAKHQFGE